MNLTHLDEQNKPKMVDVSGKNSTSRIARAESRIYLPEEIMQKITFENLEIVQKAQQEP